MRADDQTPGPFVPLTSAPNGRRAESLVRVLEKNGIPAWLAQDHPAWSKTGATWVMVPRGMLEPARRTLRTQSREPSPAPGRVAAMAVPSREPGTVTREGMQVRALRIPAPQTPPAVREPFPSDLLDEPAIPREKVRSSGTPFPVRLGLALAAFITPYVSQLAYDARHGAGAAARAFGARLPLDWAGVHRLVTAGWVHGSLRHAFWNAVFGVVLGVVLSGTHGIGATAAVWLLSSMAGIGAECWGTEGALVLGASAGNYGLVGMWAQSQLRKPAPVLPHRKRIRVLGVLLLLVPGALTPFTSTGARVAVLAHVVGFVVGCVLGRAFEPRLDAKLEAT